MIGTVAITGGYGFLGWHLACRIRALKGVEPTRLARAHFSDNERLSNALEGVDTIFHLAGVNRARSDEAVERGNLELAHSLGRAIESNGRPVHVVYSNSIQSHRDNAYGRGKAEAGRIIADAVHRAGGTFADVVLPNLFGEHGRPGYNSFVATFCHEVARGLVPEVTGDNQVSLMHAQGAANVLMDAAAARKDVRIEPTCAAFGVPEILGMIRKFHELYADGDVPPLTDQFSTDLFNTYRSYVFPQHFPFRVKVHGDKRGNLYESVRSHGGPGQTFVSTTVPGATRGDHFHLHKVERFFVIKGAAEIALRRLYHRDVVRFRVSGGEPSFVDMPTMWVHKITNVEDSELVTMFWADQLLDPDNSDQYPARVEVAAP